jgi:Flp pilus assembly pilin Flp
MINNIIVKALVARNTAQQGQALVEYGLVIGAVSIAALVGATALGGSLNEMFNALSDAVKGFPPTA